MITDTKKILVNYNIDSPLENQVINDLNFHLQGWITLDEPYETDYYFSDGNTSIKLTPFERKDVEQAFPEKYVFGFSQTISTIEILTNRHYFIKFSGPIKEHRILVPIKIETDKSEFASKKENKRDKLNTIIQCPLSGDTQYITAVSYTHLTLPTTSRV